MPKRAARGIELLADPTRRAIIALVAVRPLWPTTIAREIGLSRPGVSRQLRLLPENGLVERQRSWADGQAFIYRIPRGRHGVITAWLAGHRGGLDGGRGRRPWASTPGLRFRRSFRFVGSISERARDGMLLRRGGY